ncbi:YeeE/YedE family protein [Myxococcus sp. CA056]|uniref:YeeE/YedE family protein n=1 Tax=Myxococcus sp. CA056 TaxID=2741740 RepID=UPI0035303933
MAHRIRHEQHRALNPFSAHATLTDRTGRVTLAPRTSLFSSGALTMNAVLLPLLGGVLIGLSAALLLLFNGRIAGISGITGGLLSAAPADRGWRASFLGGLAVGGVLLATFRPESLGPPVLTSVGATLVAGLLVGFGTQLGGGCTSGHGVCGLARGSKRSLVATLTFMATGAIAVFISRHVLGGVS